MKEINIGIIGCGIVGTGVAKILTRQKELIQSRLGTVLTLKRVADLDITTDRGVHFEEGVLTTDAGDIVDDPDIDIVVEMIGGTGFAREIILRAIENGKHIVTANKALLAEDGNTIFRAAAEKGVEVAFEASVGGCMPIIKSLRESLIGNRIESMTGILNGTCNYILTKITNEGLSFEKALKKAQDNGFAEADPTFDVEGIDTAHKLAILSAIAFGTEIHLSDIYVEGITKITALDIELARQFGYKIKLLAIAKNRKGKIEARIHPTMIPEDHILSSVSGSLNAIDITGDAVGDMLLYGHGAGMMPTASAVTSDIADLARNIKNGSGIRIAPMSYQMDKISEIPVMPIDDISLHYYFRFSAADEPGVLSLISGILGKYGISLKTVHQKGRNSTDAVSIVMLTHLAKEADVNKALEEISQLDVVSAPPVIIRIEDEPSESCAI